MSDAPATPTMPAAPAAPSPAASDRSDPALRALLLSLGTAVFIVNLDSRAVAPLLPAIASDLGLSIGRVGLLVSSYLLPYGLFQLAYGPLADRYGKLRVSAHALLIFSVGTALCGVGSSFTAMVAFRVLTGATGAALFPLALAFIGDTVPYAQRQATIALLMASAGAAQAFGAGAGGLLAAVVSWRTVFPVIGALGGAAALALFLLERRQPPAPAAPPGRRASALDALRAPGLRTLLVLVSVEGLLYIGGLSFLSGLLETRFGLGVLASGLVLSLSGVAQLAGARMLPLLVRRAGEGALLVSGGSLMAGGYLLAALAPVWALVGAACLMTGLGFTLCHSTLQTRATEAFPQARGTAVSLFAFSLFAGSGAGALLYAGAIDRFGYAAVFGAAGALLGAYTAVTARALRRRVAAAPAPAAPAAPDLA
ncbi:MFS transporter [Sorangium sp. So ce321]|uniref:MFS transporter n=1 Tax=Sorangium sp. So ce321 TaxID=3133300 RepID=UPI003F632CDA